MRDAAPAASKLKIQIPSIFWCFCLLFIHFPITISFFLFLHYAFYLSCFVFCAWSCLYLVIVPLSSWGLFSLLT